MRVHTSDINDELLTTTQASEVTLVGEPEVDVALLKLGLHREAQFQKKREAVPFRVACRSESIKRKEMSRAEGKQIADDQEPTLRTCHMDSNENISSPATTEVYSEDELFHECG